MKKILYAGLALAIAMLATRTQEPELKDGETVRVVFENRRFIIR